MPSEKTGELGWVSLTGAHRMPWQKSSALSQAISCMPTAQGERENRMSRSGRSWNMVLYPNSLICCRTKINKWCGTAFHTVSMLVGLNFKKYLNLVVLLYVLKRLNNQNERNQTTIFCSLSHIPSCCQASVGGLVWLSFWGLVLHFAITFTFFFPLTFCICTKCVTSYVSFQAVTSFQLSPDQLYYFIPKHF